MSKSRRFASATSVTDNISSIAQSSRQTTMGSEMIPLARIIRDPGNHRTIPINWDNPREEILDSDPNAAEKRDFLEKLEGLAASIESAGLINPIQVYRRGADFILATGQRRLLAHKLLQREVIFCVIIRDPQVRLQQWIENTQREEPTLADRLRGVIDMLDEAAVPLDDYREVLDFLRDKAGMGRSNGYLWASVLSGPEAVRVAMLDGALLSLREAGNIAGLKGEELQAALDALHELQAVQKELAPPDLSSAETEQNDEARKKEPPGSVPAPPAGSVRVNQRRGFRATRSIVVKTKNPEAARVIVEKVLGKEFVESVDFGDVKQVNDLLKRMIETVEKQLHEAG